MPKQIQTESSFDPGTNVGTYDHKMHHHEMNAEARVSAVGGPTAYGQNLAATKGLSGTTDIVGDRYAKIKKDR